MPQSLSSNYRSIVAVKMAVLFGLVVLCCLFLFLDITTGPAQISYGDVLYGLFDPSSLEARQRIILWDIRLPDALMAIVIGVALGLAGLETQTGLNNPLASPFTLGISSAAVLGASVSIVLFPHHDFFSSQMALPATALVFSLIASMLIILFTFSQNGARSAVILFGIALMFLCNALTGILQYIASAEAVQQIVFWTIGNLTKAGWREVGIVTAVFVCILPFSLRHVWVMTLLRSGESQTASAGIDVGRLRFLMIVRVSILTAFAVCFVGTIGFVGLVGPHIARLLLGEDHRFLLPGSCLCGAVILSLASFLSKAVIPGLLVPVGIITSFIGVPILVLLILTRGRRL